MPDITGAERYEPRLRRVGDDSRERRLAGARRPPEDDRLEQVALDRLAQRPAGCQQLFLADEFVEGPRTHPLGQRRAGLGGAGGGFFGKERVHGFHGSPKGLRYAVVAIRARSAGL
jgi:hypothetical protein